MKKVTFLWLLGPLLCLVVLCIIILIERAGVSYQDSLTKAVFLPEHVISEELEDKVESALLFSSESKVSIKNKNSIAYVLKSMDVKYDEIDLFTEEFPKLEQYATAVLAIENYEVMETDYVYFTNWVKDGGRALLAIAPEFTPVFQAIYPKLGIQYSNELYCDIKGLTFLTNLMPGSKGLSFGEEAISGRHLALNVAEDSIKHIVSTGEDRLPILWEHDYGKGKFVVNNSDIFEYKDTRGIVTAAYSLLEDICVYPVINSSMFFIDDFPAPIPMGSYEIITEQYGRDIASFYQNIWWPDILEISRKYGLKYTGLMIQTYNDLVSPPFTGAEEDREVFNNFGAMLIKSGGELGLHGYNHMPLCLENFDYQGQVDYKAWPNKENMKASIDELITFAKDLFPGNEYVTYVPPSNILSIEGRAMLAENYPEIKVISGSYLADYFYESEQEFDVGEDGIINVPRIVSGCDVDPYMKWVALNELNFHYINSHFTHPDDVLDVDRGAEKGWEYLIQKLEEYVQWVEDSAPGIRHQTASQGAAAVERYDMLSLMDSHSNNKIDISLGGFYDEAWLMIRMNEGKPGEVTGGTLEHITGNLYLLHAKEAKVTINTMEMR